MSPQKRPLTLMHVCNECTLFSVRRQPLRQANNGILQQTLIVAAPFCSNDTDSSSPFSSPASSADSSPETSGLSSPKPAPVRHRSHSECTDRSPVKSILKRRPMFRSLSECEEEGYNNMLKRYGQSLEDVSESDSQLYDDAIVGSPQSLNEFKKKSVSFSERVEENVFRPGSSILGQRKKNQRKAKARKRRESCDSMTMSSEENEEEQRRHSVDVLQKCSDVSAVKTTDADENIIPARVTTAHNDTASIVDQTKTKKSKDSKNARKKCKDRNKSHAIPNPILSDDRYKGFVIGIQQRRPSTDSALSASTDDDDNDNDFVVVDNDRHSSFELKDSGIDDEMEELCAQMTAAVVSA